MKKLFRENITTINQYEPGLPLELLRKKISFRGKFSKLASNENPLGPSPLALRALRNSLKEGNYYPENTCFKLREKLSENLRIPPANICVGNGSAELIYLLGLVFLNPEDTLVTSECSFMMGRVVSQIMASKLVEVPLRGFKHDLDSILEAITEETKIIYLDNPMNPIGTMVDKNEVSRFMSRIDEDVVVVFDEAYYEYAEGENFPQTVEYVKEGRNVIVLRTFSKLYGLAGLRIGYCIAKEEFVKCLQQVKPPFSVNRLAQEAALAALEDEKHKKKSLEINASGKKYLTEKFKEMSVFFIPSETNFLTIDVKRDAKQMAEMLEKKGVIVRPLTMYQKPTFIRITIGTEKENQRFIRAFREIWEMG